MTLSQKAATDDEWQRSKRDQFLVPLFYQRHAVTFRFVDSDPAIQRRGFDTVAVWRNNSPLYAMDGDGERHIEEKIVRWPKNEDGTLREYGYTALFLETQSCTNPGHESDGWMVYSEAHLLLYCFEQLDGTLECCLYRMQELKEWFWRFYEDFPMSRMATANRTEGRVVSCNDAAIFLIRRWKLKPSELPQAQLPLPPPPLPARAFVHYCPTCGQWGSFGYGVSLLKGEEGLWFCGEHRPDRNADLK